MEINLEEMLNLAKDISRDKWGNEDALKILEKLSEEVYELEKAMSMIHDDIANAQPHMKMDVMKEFGDVLFCIARFADQSKINIKDALSLTIVKIQERNKFGFE